MEILLLGIGQSLRGDDAAGLEVVRLWQAHHPDSAANVQVELYELPGLALLDLLENVDVAVLVDAVQVSEPPGKILCLGQDELASFTPEAGFAHGWGVAETLKLGRSLYPSLENCQITLIGIVGKEFKTGVSLSPEVREALEAAADAVDCEINKAIN